MGSHWVCELARPVSKPAGGGVAETVCPADQVAAVESTDAVLLGDWEDDAADPCVEALEGSDIVSLNLSHAEMPKCESMTLLVHFQGLKNPRLYL